MDKLNNIIFNNDINCFEDWNIVLTEINIPFPTPKISLIDIPGSDGVIDLSEVLTGDVKYNNRVCKLTFEMLDLTDYTNLMSEISNLIHGKVVTFIQTNDENYFYRGRATISEWECIKNQGKIVIEVDCEPYKYNIKETKMNVILNNESKTVRINNDRMPVCPTLVVNGDVSIVIDGETYKLEVGEQQLLGFILEDGVNEFTFSGNGSINITYRKGSL